MKKLLVLSLVLLIASCSKSSKTQPTASDLNFFSKNNNAKTSTIIADCYADWTNGVDTNLGTNTAPKKHIQACINAVSSGQTVIAKSGTPTTPKIYLENINFNGKNITVASNFINTGDPNDIYGTIIDGNHNGSVVTIASGENNNAQLMGFTIQHGQAINGGGVYIHSGDGSNPPSSFFATTPKLSYLRITSNTATDSGGGIYMAFSTTGADASYNNVPTVMENLEITYNTAVTGGGIYALNSVITLKETKLISNSASNSGGMMLGFVDVVGDMDKLYIYGNQARRYGGANISRSYNNYQSASNIRITNSVITQNIATTPKDEGCQYGSACGGMYLEIGDAHQGDTSKIDVINSTFADNKTKSNEGGGLCPNPQGQGTINVINSIFWGNTKWHEAIGMTEGPIQILLYAPNVNLSYNNIQELSSTGVIYLSPYPNTSPTPLSIFLVGNIDSNPLFVDPINGNYSINLNSPAVNTGTNAITISGQNIAIPTDDIVNMVRPSPSGTKVDMGAYEVEQVVVPTFDSRPSNGLIVKPFKPVHH